MQITPMKHGFLKDVAVFSLAQIGAGVILMGYMIITARLLDVAEYGLFQAVIGIYGILFVLGSLLNITTVHCVGSARQSDQAATLGACLQLSFLIGGICAAVVALLSPFLAQVLHSDTALPLISLSFLVFIALILSVFYGGLQGRNQYAAYSVAKITECCLSFCIGVVLIFYGAESAGAVMGYASGMCVITLFFLVRHRLYCFDEGVVPVGRNLRSLLRPVAVSSTLFFALSCPMIIARIRLAEHVSGLYGSLFSLRNMLHPFALAVSIPLYSRTVSKQREGHMLSKALVLVLSVSVGFIFVSLAFPNWLFQTLFGDEYVEAARYMWMYGINLLLYTTSMVIMFHQVAHRALRMYLLPLPVLPVLAIATIAQLDIWKIILAQIVGWGAFLVCLVAPKLFQIITRREA